MPTSRAVFAKTADVYARTLFEGAAADGSVDVADESLHTMAATLREHSQLRWTLTDAFVPGEAKRAIVREVFAGQHPMAVEVVATMAEMDNLDVLGDAVLDYERIAEAERGVAVLEVTTAVSLTEELRASLVRRLSADLGKPVALRERVDQAILGGIIVNRSGRVLDASVSSRLATARRALSSATTGGEA